MDISLRLFHEGSVEGKRVRLTFDLKRCNGRIYGDMAGKTFWGEFKNIEDVLSCELYGVDCDRLEYGLLKLIHMCWNAWLERED